MTTRRDFLATLAAAAALPPWRQQAAVAAAADACLDPASAVTTGQPKPLKLAEIPGFLSKDQLAAHHTAHYGGAVKSLAAIETGLEGADRSKANANWSDLRELKREQAHAMNSIVLHELYFGGLAAAAAAPGERAQARLAQRFGSLDRWIEDLKAAAICARGWAMLVYQRVNGRLYNVVADVHDVGPVVLGMPLVVIDCYEHAFYIDYRNKKADYVAAFPKFVDWSEIDRRFATLP